MVYGSFLFVNVHRVHGGHLTMETVNQLVASSFPSLKFVPGKRKRARFFLADWNRNDLFMAFFCRDDLLKVLLGFFLPNSELRGIKMSS